MTVLVVTTRAELAPARAALSGRVAVVMTMGALHEGHLALVRAAREAADAVLVTVFVNPLQFAAGEDLERYPRTLDADVALLAAEGVDLVLAPTRDEVYPLRQEVQVSAGRLGAVFEGASRPGHFDGVLTVVLKLMHLTRPDVAVFGEKDAQQLALVRRMVDDLALDVRVLGVPTVRDRDGLALSSRNRYLDPGERSSALALSKALRAGAAAAAGGRQAVLAAASAELARAEHVRLDYLALVGEPGLEPDPEEGPARLLVAARVGTTRLIDNQSLCLGQAPLLVSTPCLAGTASAGSTTPLELSCCAP